MRTRATGTIVPPNALVRVFGVRLDVLLEVLRTFEGFAAHFTFMRLERDVHTDVGRDMVSLHRGGVTISPSAHEVKVVGRFATNMLLAHVIIKRFGVWMVLAATLPLTRDCRTIFASRRRRRSATTSGAFCSRLARGRRRGGTRVCSGSFDSRRIGFVGHDDTGLGFPLRVECQDLPLTGTRLPRTGEMGRGYPFWLRMGILGNA